MCINYAQTVRNRARLQIAFCSQRFGLIHGRVAYVLRYIVPPKIRTSDVRILGGGDIQEESGGDGVYTKGILYAGHIRLACAREFSANFCTYIWLHALQSMDLDELDGRSYAAPGDVILKSSQ